MANDPRWVNTDDVVFVDWTGVAWVGRFEVIRAGAHEFYFKDKPGPFYFKDKPGPFMFGEQA